MKYLDLESQPNEVSEFLRQLNWLENNDEKVISIVKPGEGNMNVVLRVKTNTRQFILKQSRPYVQKYQSLEAPLDRIFVENQFYNAISKAQVKRIVPKVLHFDPSHYLMMMEDLGDCKDMSSIYNSKEIRPSHFDQLIAFLNQIHQSIPQEEYPQNLELRQLNHQHIFVLPFDVENGFDLDTVQQGLAQLAIPYQQNEDLKNIINKLGKLYLQKGETLIHGDYYPGSWMQKDRAVFVLDPEFSFMGFPEFDLGVMAAHILMSTNNEEVFQNIKHKYSLDYNEILVLQIAGVEIMRRLIGLAQLPLERSLEEKKMLLNKAQNLIFS